jgi:hypothetical protein
VAEGFRDSQGGKYFWLDWAPGVRWGANGGFIYRGSVRQLVDATLLTGFYRWGGMLREPAGADECCVLRMRWREDAADTLVFEFGQFITIAPEISEKGISEPSFEFLDDGRIFVTLRASGNARTGTWARRYYALSTDRAGPGGRRRNSSTTTARASTCRNPCRT